MKTTVEQGVLQTRIREARLEDWRAVAALLAEARLVALDETAQFGPQYAVAEGPEGRIVGVAGYERYGMAILLRSVVVSESHRRAGIGTRLATDRLLHAQRQGCSVAYLLTDTARGYWERHGFSAIERASAPVAITRSVEWSHACPASATAMRRALDRV